jgi:hypothetical protein
MSTAAALDGLQSREWRTNYRTSALQPDGRPLDMLHDFYIPALERSVRYDRVAGYFSSSSLAAASQGFSAFVGKGGQARMIVGADVSPGDVQAILDGDHQRYVQHLENSLGESTTWPQDVRRGVDLLAWMVAHAYLEIRVAFRLHASTREAIPYGSHEDGH